MLKLLLFIILDLNSCLFWVISMQFAYIGFLSLAAFQYVIWLPSTSMCYFAEGEDGKKKNYCWGAYLPVGVIISFACRNSVVVPPPPLFFFFNF